MSDATVNLRLLLVRQPQSVHFLLQKSQFFFIGVLAFWVWIIQQVRHAFKHHLDLELAFDAFHRLIVQVPAFLARLLFELLAVLAYDLAGNLRRRHS